MDLQEFRQRFREVKGMGFVKSLRKGSTGVGYTFETLVGVAENNLALPDIEGVEIKTHREGANSMITLFTFNKKVWRMEPLEAIRKYGSRNDKGRLGMYYTMSLTPNSAGLFLTVDDEQISVQHISGEVIAVWPMKAIAEKFVRKMPALLLVSAHTEERARVEYFHFYRAQLMQGTGAGLLSELFKTGKLPLLFNKVEDI